MRMTSYPATSELPPHARRIHIEKGTGAWGTGTTSACAENTLIEAQAHITEGNYLRMRGEYWGQCFENHFEGELPPHARRILHAALSQGEHRGTTSACAENTLSGSRVNGSPRNYLRMRGEYPK